MKSQTTPATPAPSLPVHVLREIAVAAAGADPRSVARVLRGERVRGAVYFRILEALRVRGITVPSPLALSSVPKPGDAR